MVITVFVISWVESLFILPAHLGHSKPRNGNPVARFLHERQQAFSRGFSTLIHRVYGPFLEWCIRYRGLTLSLGVALLAVIIGYVVSGRIGLILMPRVESDASVVTAVLPYGSPVEKTEAVRDRLVIAAQRVVDAHGGDTLVKGIFAELEPSQGGGPGLPHRSRGAAHEHHRVHPGLAGRDGNHRGASNPSSSSRTAAVRDRGRPSPSS